MLPSRRDILQTAAAGVLGTGPLSRLRRVGGRDVGVVQGNLTGAEAVVDTLIQEGVSCVFGIPGAQQNELWDTMKSRRLGYLLVTHEFSAAGMADGYARSTGRPGVICIVPGPGLTNALSGLGEALLDSVPIVAIVGDVANGCRHHAFQVHSLDQTALLRPVTKEVFTVERIADIPSMIQLAFQRACSGEPGPTAVVIPYNLLIETARFNCPPLAEPGVPFDQPAFEQAMMILADRRHRVGLYVGQGCMNYAPSVVQLAEVLQAPVATSMAGKGAMPETHPLSVGWGYGPQGRLAAQQAFRHVDCVLAIGVKYAEVSTGFYSQPQTPQLIHVDINENNLGRIMRTTQCVHADAGVFLSQALEQADRIRRPCNAHLVPSIEASKRQEARKASINYARCGVDPMCFLRTLRRLTGDDTLAFVDVTLSQYWATEVFTTVQPRTYFNPTNNQSMGWSIPAALGAQRAHPGRQVITITGDGCFLMSAMEISTAARAGLPVKFFILDDQAYHYMQELQQAAYMRTTATILARLDYRALAQGWGVSYQEITSNDQLESRIAGSLLCDGPVLTRICIDYRGRPVRWIDAARAKYFRELCPAQKLRFIARAGTRALDRRPEND